MNGYAYLFCEPIKWIFGIVPPLNYTQADISPNGI